MGILDRLGLGKRTGDMLAGGSIHLDLNPYLSGPNHLLPAIVVDDLTREALEDQPIGREVAITIPAVSKARNLLTSSIARFPLRALKAGAVVANQPTFLYRTDNSVTPYERMAWTVDDLIFYGCSLWIVERGAAPAGSKFGPIKSAEWCPRRDWSVNPDGNVEVRQAVVSDDQYVLFNSPFEGLVNIASRTLKGARDQEAAWVGRARNPVPLIELHQLDESLDPDEVKPFVDAWASARSSENGAIGYTPSSLEIRTHGEVKADLMTEGRNAVRTDVGSFLNVRASMLDGTAGIDSLTYTTSEGERNAFYDIDLPFWIDPIEARLSMDDVVPRGQYVRFDKYEQYHLPEPTGQSVED